MSRRLPRLVHFILKTPSMLTLMRSRIRRPDADKAHTNGLSPADVAVADVVYPEAPALLLSVRPGGACASRPEPDLETATDHDEPIFSLGQSDDSVRRSKPDEQARRACADLASEISRALKTGVAEAVDEEGFKTAAEATEQVRASSPLLESERRTLPPNAAPER